jgi:hypothetical protein
MCGSLPTAMSFWVPVTLESRLRILGIGGDSDSGVVLRVHLSFEDFGVDKSVGIW